MNTIRGALGTVVVAACLLGAGGVAPTASASSAVVKHKGLPAGYTVVVTPKGVIAGYARPNGPKVRNVPSTWHGEPLTMPVRKERRGFDDVRLPGRPNGSTIWVRQSDVFTSASPYEIIVNLATTHLKLVYKGRTVMNVPAGVGTSSNPTPKGRFFVAFYAQSPNAGYGPFVLVTSAHSNTITDWESSGDAMVAIHGPLGAGSVIGNAGAHISHGCIRLHVKDLNRLNVVPVGSPVIVVY